MVPPRTAWRLAVTALLALPFVHASPAQAAPIGQGLTITPADLSYILKQIKIAEAHVANTTSRPGPAARWSAPAPTSSPARCCRSGCGPSTAAATTSSRARRRSARRTRCSRA